MKLPKLKTLCEMVAEAVPPQAPPPASSPNPVAASTPNRRPATPQGSGMIDQLETSNINKPVHVNTKFGPTLIFKIPQGNFAIFIGKLEYPKDPSYVLVDSDAVLDWMKDVGAISTTPNSLT